MRTTSESIGLFLFHCQYEKNLTEKTLKAYRTDLRQFVEHLGRGAGGADVAAIGKDVIRGYLKRLFESYRPRSIKRKIATLKAFFSYLEYEEQIESNPFRKLRIKVDRARELPRTMSLETVSGIFRAAYADKAALRRGSGGYIRCVRDIAVLELLFATGMRVGELCALRSEDVDLGAGNVRITGKGRRERIVPLCGVEVTAALTEHLRYADPSCGHLFRITDQQVRSFLSRYAARGAAGKHVTPHMFRHTVATMLLGNGVDIRNIQVLLGHSSIGVTEIYAHVNEACQRKAIASAHPRGDIEEGRLG
ncbi:tyrosine-type recombinase/integrase [Pseudodesulfovibrio sp.]|uniref:tyrosine-type recombinase/integrase n=1 Tax=Pseudodesulfovibrio sp. TaxID=2035812 RepID=UPI00260844EE|nr:tyrosine-type recombinase/integrase [Pseudodesulfovibrio sp.]MDD3312383.1 tyrosine-type recombinase/integrase [Pseudodesulfovibrio sp.]